MTSVDELAEFVSKTFPLDELEDMHRCLGNVDSFNKLPFTERCLLSAQVSDKVLKQVSGWLLPNEDPSSPKKFIYRFARDVDIDMDCHIWDCGKDKDGKAFFWCSVEAADGSGTIVEFTGSELFKKQIMKHPLDLQGLHAYLVRMGELLEKDLLVWVDGE